MEPQLKNSEIAYSLVMSELCGYRSVSVNLLWYVSVLSHNMSYSVVCLSQRVSQSVVVRFSTITQHVLQCFAELNPTNPSSDSAMSGIQSSYRVISSSAHSQLYLFIELSVSLSS